MRGFDYRAPSKGITLIIAKLFKSKRDYNQALLRVGRYGDACQRFVTMLENKECVDTKLRDEAMKTLFLF